MKITSNEMKLTEDNFLLSETDEKGIIMYANDEFCQFSEYSKDELIGNPHNIIRHPDMPKEAFEDLWKTIKSGKSWKGFVKNKTKTNKYYWVFATIFPFISSDGVKGYLSCRRKASEEEIEKYEEIYKKMRKK